MATGAGGMKRVWTIGLLLVMDAAWGQTGSFFSAIDEEVANIEAPSPDSLAKVLTASYSTDLQKVRAIFSWIAQHISYNTYVIRSNRERAASSYVAIPDDTAAAWKSATEMTAIKVLKKRTAVCDGYAKLFKTLCNDAGIPSEVITGYARGYAGGNDRFHSNHTWNAVLIDSTWRLLDLTWASGYIDFDNQFVRRLDEHYFLTPPQDFIRDHYPENIEWALLDNPPDISEFKRMPFRTKSFVKYGIESYWPPKGLIEASEGDTLHWEIILKDPERDQRISPDPFFDSTNMSRAPYSIFLSPLEREGHKRHYSYVVDGLPIEWLNIVYNQDMILRYRLHKKKDLAWQSGKE